MTQYNTYFLEFQLKFHFESSNISLLREIYQCNMYFFRFRIVEATESVDRPKIRNPMTIAKVHPPQSKCIAGFTSMRLMM